MSDHVIKHNSNHLQDWASEGSFLEAPIIFEPQSWDQADRNLYNADETALVKKHMKMPVTGSLLDSFLSSTHTQSIVPLPEGYTKADQDMTQGQGHWCTENSPKASSGHSSQLPMELDQEYYKFKETFFATGEASHGSVNFAPCSTAGQYCTHPCNLKSEPRIPPPEIPARSSKSLQSQIPSFTRAFLDQVITNTAGDGQSAESSKRNIGMFPQSLKFHETRIE